MCHICNIEYVEYVCLYIYIYIYIFIQNLYKKIYSQSQLSTKIRNIRD